MSPKILVVEDDKPLAEIIRFNLNRAGCDILVSHDGLEAIELATKTPFDLIILDVGLPKFSGAAVCSNVRANGPNTETPIILCTGSASDSDLEFLRKKFRIAEVITKPFSPVSLVEMVMIILTMTPPDLQPREDADEHDS